MICDKCEQRGCAGQAFTRYKCEICNEFKYYHNTDVPRVCVSCSEEKGICQRCKVLI